jgi:Family of unknown function (DUF5946)
MNSNEEAYNELCCYTLAHGDPSFIHQHVVDAFSAQTADDDTKPIKLAFALIGLYLHFEREFSGKQIQRAHMFLARRKRIWPSFPLPHDRGSMTVAHVMAVAAGAKRDKAIHEWCAAVWKAFHESHEMVGELAQELFVRTNSFTS